MSIVTSRSENNKLKQWVDSVMTIPFGKYKGTNLDSIKPEKVKDFLDGLQTSMDSAAYGHDEAKRQIIQMMGQQIKNPKARGNMLGLYGPPGNGKTSLIKEGIAKAMDKPFIFISLGGATDASFLEGHSFTYEGSIYGRIVNGLINAKCMDPIIYFDELDKISNTPKGDEITNILVHLTDPVQNTNFRDKYFHGIDIDLSRATMIFSFNDRSRVNHILADRITMVETKFLLPVQKINIVQNYLCPAIFKEMGFMDNGVVFSDEVIRNMIDLYTREGGVRKLKGLIYNICRELNLANLTKTKVDGKPVKFPFTMENKHLKLLLTHKMEIDQDKIHVEPKYGVINGLYASGDGGHGGILPIEILWIPASKPFEIKATGNLEKVIKESTDVASTLAFNYLAKDKQDEMLKEMKEYPRGFHIHLGDGSVSKDGPSAGTALTVALVSMLSNRKIRNDIAITGEITLQGKVTAIGGLENKLQGAKSAGVKLVLYPKENQKHIDKIKERNPTLIDSNLQVIAIETIDEAIKHSLV
jgi:endopeptidase La